MSVVHMCWLATPVHRDLSGYWVCCFISELQKASAFALPISLQICDKRPLTHLGMTKILRLCMKLCTKPQTSQSCHWLCHSHLPALPQLAQDFTVMKLNYMVTWKASHKSRVSYSVLKMAGAYSVWMFNTFFFPFDIHCQFTEWSSQLVPETQPAHSWVPALLSTWVLPHKACIFYSI